MKCEKCGYDVRGGKIFEKHHTRCDGSGPRSVKIRKPGGKSWSKGLTKDNDETLQKISESLTGKSTWVAGSLLSDEHRKSIAKGMVKAHEDGRAHNIGSSRWNNEPSYPEKFFAEVIANEFNDKSYVREYPFSRYSLDFAWPHLKLVIEIDGDQHERFEKQRESDARKDAALIEAGWKVLRIKWREMYANTKEEIAKCKSFIDNSQLR